MDTRVYLIRHGRTQHPVDSTGRKLTYGPEAELSSEGRLDIKRFGEGFKAAHVHLDVIYSSPFVRATQTAQILTEQFNVDRIDVREGLREVHVPGWWGIPLDEAERIGADIYSQAPRSKDQETLDDVGKRIVRAFYDILTREKGKTIGIVGHGDPIQVLLFRLEHPHDPISSYSELVSYAHYLRKGEAWRLLFDHNVRLIERTLVGSEWIGESESESWRVKESK